MSENRLRVSRRGFIGGAAGAAASVALLGNVPAVLADAAEGRKGSLDRIEHVVILMQENRAFDHYFGTMQGVRGFGDRTFLRQNNGNDIFHQLDSQRTDGGLLLPWRMDTSKVDGDEVVDTPHGWNDTHAAWNGGLWNQWVPNKTEFSMSYYDESDNPFQRARARAFTLCDHYFCSVHGPTTPNRCYLWTGTIDPEGQHGGPCAANPNDYLPVFNWTTYPERLQAAHISWQVYANDEVGDDDSDDNGFVGDFGDNPLWLFQQYHDSLNSSDPKVRELALRGGLHDGWKPNSEQGKDTRHVLAQFITDCQRGTLPSVSWVVAPYLYSEHPLGRPVDGAAYVQTMLNAIWSNSKLAGSTVVFIDYDENDGFFDHIVPPAAPPGTRGEFLPAHQPGFRGQPPASGPLVPIGLGPRVPMLVISPWSQGGWINSQVFDHTSVLRFLEVWTGVREQNISTWRRSICGDLTTCFDLENPRFIIPMLPDTTALRQHADDVEKKLPAPVPPPVGQQIAPVQQAGTAKARALPYQPIVNFELKGGQLVASMSNSGQVALQVGLYAHGPLADTASRFDVAPGVKVTTSVVPETASGVYDVEIHGPNGFYRRAAGTLLGPESGVEATLALIGGDHNPRLKLTVRNRGTQPQTVIISGVHGQPLQFTLSRGSERNVDLDPVDDGSGWYELIVSVDGSPQFTRRFAGHLENGEPSRTSAS